MSTVAHGREKKAKPVITPAIAVNTLALPSEHSNYSGRRPGRGPEPAEKQFEDPPHTPIVIIMAGHCNVVNPNDGQLITTLKPGDVFGDSDFFKY